MSEELFEIAFSGVIKPGVDAESVKQKIGQIFKADGERLQQMFSGRRVLIKRQVDAVTAAKYQAAFEKAGAICEVKSLSKTAGSQDQGGSISSSASAKPETASAHTSTSTTAKDYVSRYPESEQIPQALLSTPLNVTGDTIQELAADVAPVGSPMQHQINEVPEPAIDTSGIDMAPVGSDLTDGPQENPPPPPDTSGLSIAD